MRNKIIHSIAFTILVPATAAFAGGYVIPNENARELSLSQSAVANQTGPEALFLNTAALAGPEGLAITVSGEILTNRTTWSDPAMGSASIIPQYTTPPNAAVSFGTHLGNDMAWGIGAGLTVPAGGALYWPDGWQGQEFIQTVEQRVFMIGFGGAFQPLPGVKLGATFLRYQATEELHQSLNFLDHQADGGISLSGGANSFGLSLEVKVPTVPLTFGVHYTHAGTLHIEGDAHFEGVPVQFSPLIHDQAVTEVLPIPNILTAGAAYAIQPNITVTGAYTFEKWDRYTDDTFVGSDGFTVVVDRNYRNAHVVRAGVEWQLAAFPALTVRGGGLRSISDQPTDTVSPSLSDGSSWAYSIGAGYNILRTLRADFGYQHAIFDKVTATGTEAFPGTYQTHVDLFSFGINWRTDLGLASK
ncbi:MAG: outer membrane protein transport protein [Kofleriaceae bacterium]